MDSLEKFIVENKEHFNEETPRELVWDKIQSDISEKKKKKKPIQRYLIVSAAAIGLVLLGAWFGMNTQMNDFERAINNSSFADYQETEQYYALQVNSYLDEINKIDPDHNIEQELIQLDEVYNELRNELMHAEIKNQDVIINAMIKNYKVKIGMLKRILEKNNKKNILNIDKINNDEKISI